MGYPRRHPADTGFASHVYDANLDAAKILLKRETKFPEEPHLEVNNELSLAEIWDGSGAGGWKPEDLRLRGYKKEFYDSHTGPAITREMTGMQSRQ